MISLALVAAFIFMLFFAKNVTTLIVGEFLINIPIGFINNVARELASTSSETVAKEGCQPPTPSRSLRCPSVIGDLRMCSCAGFWDIYSALELFVNHLF